MGIFEGPDAWLRATQVVRLGEESESWLQVEMPAVTNTRSQDHEGFDILAGE